MLLIPLIATLFLHFFDLSSLHPFSFLIIYMYTILHTYIPHICTPPYIHTYTYGSRWELKDLLRTYIRMSQFFSFEGFAFNARTTNLDFILGFNNGFLLFLHLMLKTLLLPEIDRR